MITREEVFKQASLYLNKEAYPNPNQITRWFFKNNLYHAWCGAFIDYIIKHDLGSDMLDSCSNFGYVPTIVKWAKEKGYWSSDFKKAKLSDLVIFNWSPNIKNNYSHVGFIIKSDNNSITSIDGNTSNEYHGNNCVAKKTRDKKFISGVVLLPYKEEKMLNIGDEIIALEDVKLYTTIEEKESKYIIRKGEKAYIRLTHSPNYIALADYNTHEYFSSAWTKEQEKFKLIEEDYKFLYEEELAKNKILQDKINKAIEDLS